jgi:hypothetical protein
MRPGVSRCFRGVPGFLKILKSVLGEAMTKRQTSYLPHVATMLVGFEFLPFLQLLFVASFSYVIMEQLIGICLGQGVAQSQSRASACPESWLFQAVLGRVRSSNASQTTAGILGCRSNNRAMRLNRICWQTMVYGFW